MPYERRHTIGSCPENGIIMGMESYHGNVIIPWPWNHTIPWEWNHTMEMESYHTKPMESYHWNHTKPMESYHGIIPSPWDHTMGSYQGHGIIPRPWDHTMESYQVNGIIPRQNHTRNFLTPFIYYNKSIQINNITRYIDLNT